MFNPNPEVDGKSRLKHIWNFRPNWEQFRLERNAIKNTICILVKFNLIQFSCVRSLCQVST